MILTVIGACSGGDSDPPSSVRALSKGLSKGTPGAQNGDDDYCTNAGNRCAQGEGDCDNNSQCATGLRCVNDNGPKFGFAPGSEVCVPAHCENGAQDGSESGIDCGGECGQCLPACTAGTPGGSGFCSGACVCGAGQGDCTRDADCAPGLACSRVGILFGYSSTTDVCLPAHCSNGARDATETDIDCGGECAPCMPNCSGTPGAEPFCQGCRCQSGQGDCDGNEQCQRGLVCKSNAGSQFNLQYLSDACVAPHCSNGALDASQGETLVDCGGPCGACGVTDFDLGTAHACDISAGRVRCWGNNASGQLGDGTLAQRSIPTLLPALTAPHTRVVAGGSHSCALSAAGVLSCWGANGSGQLGNGTTASTTTPVTVTGAPSNVAELTAGANHTCARSGGNVYCWGDNAAGQLGNGALGGIQSSPVQVVGIDTAKQLSAGLNHTCAVLVDGSVRCWGANDSAKLGNGSAVPASGTPSVVAGVAGATQVAAGDTHSCALTAAGSVYCWGNNTSNMLSIGATNDGRVPTLVPGVSSGISIAAGAATTCVALSSAGGYVRCWGHGAQGQLGSGATPDAPAPPTQVLVAGKTTVVKGGGQFMCSHTSIAPGVVRCWGDDHFGQLGKGTTPFQSRPEVVWPPPPAATKIEAGDVSSCAVADGQVYCWGKNDTGQVGDGTLLQRRTPTAVSGASSAIDIAVGNQHACAVFSSGAVKCWGSNAVGQFGTGNVTSSAVPVANGVTNALSIDAGTHTTCVLRTNGSISCWGRGAEGQLGNGTTAQSSTPVNVALASASDLALGLRHACAIAGGTVHCWGANASGQLGDGGTTNRSTPFQVPGITGAVAIAAGQHHSCAVVESGELYCWGGNADGQLGGDYAASPTPRLVPGIENARDVSTWGSFTCSLLKTGGLRCWGQNTRGQLGSGFNLANTPEVRSVDGIWSAVAAGGRHACGLLTSGQIRCWGYNDYGQTGNGKAWIFPEAATAFPPATPSAAPIECFSNADCSHGQVCWQGQGPRFGLPQGTSACANAECSSSPTPSCGAPDMKCGACENAPRACDGSAGSCRDGETCGAENGRSFGMSGAARACWPAACENADFRAANCGTRQAMCGVCDGSVEYCSDDWQCGTGRVCGSDNGGHFGVGSSEDVCWPATCPTNPSEPGCHREPTVCAADADCRSGEVCGGDNADRFGLWNSRVCWPAACETDAESACGTLGSACGLCPCAPNCDDGGALVRRALSVPSPNGTSLALFSVLANGSAELRGGAMLGGALGNVGTGHTLVGDDTILSGVFSRGPLSVLERSVVHGVARTGSSHDVAASALVGEGVQPYTFDPLELHRFSVAYPSAAGANVTLAQSEARLLAPGRYGRVTLAAGSRLELGEGTYVFAEVVGLESTAQLATEDADGPVELFVEKPFVLRAQVAVGESGALLLGVFESGSLRLESAFHGTVVAPNAALALARPENGEHVGAFYGKDVIVEEGASIEFEAPAALACKPSSFSVPVPGSCGGPGLSILSHDGVTRALWEGEEEVDTGKRVREREDFVFTFSQPVAIDKLAAAVHVRSVDCAVPNVPAGCVHDVALHFSYPSADRRTVVVENPSDPFVPGCRYRLEIDALPIAAASDACLGEPATLDFRSLSRTDGSALAYEAKILRFDPERLVASVEFENTISWRADELFRERADELGLSAPSDGVRASGDPKESGVAPDHQQIYFQQVVGDVAVAGSGYRVHSESSSGRVHSLTGNATPDVHPEIPTLSEAQAVTRARAESPQPDTQTHGVELLYVPKRSITSTEHTLAYRVTLVDGEGLVRRVVDVDAATGSLIHSAPGVESAAPNPPCTSVDVTTLVEPVPLSSVMPVELDTVQSVAGFVDPTTLYVTEYTDTSGARVFALDERGVVAPANGIPPGSASVFTQCPGQVYPSVMRLPADNMTPTWSIPEQVGAQFQLAIHSCLQYLAERPRGYRANNQQWIGMDGTGTYPVDIRIDGSVPFNGAQFNASAAGGGTIEVSPAFPDGASFEVACHELGHGIWNNLGLYSPDLESRSLNEGFSDAFAAGVEFSVRRDEASAWCIRGDQITNPNGWCAERIDHPELSKTDYGRPSKERPTLYQGENWCDDCTAIDDVHVNSGVFQKWFYRVVKGETGQNQRSCSFAVNPLAPTTLESFDLANEILFTALRDAYVAGGGYRAMANATIAAALSIHGEGPAVDTVTNAWHSVGVWENAWKGENPYLVPARNATKVSPWVDFTWTVPGEATSSDFQLDVLPSFDSQGPPGAGIPLVERRMFAHEVAGYDDPTPVGRFSLTLEPNTTYFWRVRPSAATAFENCYAIHSFTTGDQPKLTGLSRPADLADGHLSGTLHVYPELFDGAKNHDFYLGREDADCSPRSNVEQHEEFAHGVFYGLEPDTSYVLNVQAIGPLDIDGHTPRSNCYKVAFRTDPLQKPVPATPADDDVIDWFDHHYDAAPGTDANRFKFYVTDGPTSYLVQFYELDDDTGECESVPSHSVELHEPCREWVPGCQVSFSTDDLGFALDNPSGYCWDVTSLSEDGDPSEPSEKSKFRYWAGFASITSPGVDFLLAEGDGVGGLPIPGTIPGDSYGMPVTLSLAPLPPGFLYEVTVGRWPWPPASSPVPAGCRWGYCRAFPAEEPSFSGLLSTNTITLEGDIAGSGRYCFSAHPVAENPDAPGTAHPNQPVVTRAVHCYTTGPSKPVIVIDNPPTERFSAEPITGYVQLDYAPDRQANFGIFDVSTGEPLLDPFPVEACYPEEFYLFSDFHDCSVPFEITPEMGKSYSIVASTWNSVEHPPVGDAESKLEDVVEIIDLAQCGGLDEFCCEPASNVPDACEFQTVCNASNEHCVKCGDLNDPCCLYIEHASGTSFDYCPSTDGSRLGCNPDTRKCAACGNLGQACCFSEETEKYYCEAGGCGPTNKCINCGKRNTPCCLGPVFTDEPFCGENLECVRPNGAEHGPGECEPTCGVEGKPCCGAPNQCDSGLQCRDGSCTQPQCTTPAVPDLGRLDDYGAYCTPNGDFTAYDTDLSLPNCTIGPPGIGGLVANRTIPCSTGLAFSWTQVPGATSYEVYFRDYASAGGLGAGGYFWGTVGSTATVNVPTCSPTVTDRCIDIPGTIFEPKVVTAVVRPINACGQKGAPAVGMIALRTSCP